MAESLNSLAKGALKDLEGVFAAMPESALDGLIDEIVKARAHRRVRPRPRGPADAGIRDAAVPHGTQCRGLGRHDGAEVGPGDLFFVSAGPGDLATASALVGIARKAGARTALITAQPKGDLARHVDVVTVIPAQTMADDQGGRLSVLPMGSLFETAQMIAFELAILRLRPLFTRRRRRCAPATRISNDGGRPELAGLKGLALNSLMPHLAPKRVPRQVTAHAADLARSAFMLAVSRHAAPLGSERGGVCQDFRRSSRGGAGRKRARQARAGSGRRREGDCRPAYRSGGFGRMRAPPRERLAARGAARG